MARSDPQSPKRNPCSDFVFFHRVLHLNHVFTRQKYYHTFSEVIARDAAADCGSDQGTTNRRIDKTVKGRLIQLRR
jgi:hypothetical protein